ncbi:unnamed protein product [Taenia asiatica]|uniref:Eukaryotic translation initiation factor 2 subunit 1 n=1 Tax=Taenia asiatica TaxID=60517 RepID=A0A0R3W0X1_TAEAS|nr:unnamed protein product [Taenia asiatica]
MPLSCRYYENEFPAENDVVVAVVTSITNSGSYVILPEYDNAIGMILHSELSRRRIRSINKLVRVGRSDIVLVIRVDPDKRYIDLSKRRVPLEETHICQDRFAKAKAVNQIVRHAAEKLGYTEKSQLEDLCAKTVWFFDKKYAGQGGSHEAFRRAVQNPSILDACDIDEKTKEMLLQDIRHRLMPQAVKLRADFEVSCFAYEGIDAVRRALHAGLALSTDDLPIKINLIAPPLYVLTTQTLEWNEGLVQLEKVLEAIKNSIEEQEGSFKLQQKPRVVSDTEEADFQRQLEELEDANKEVSGDEDDEDEDDGEDEDEGGEEGQDMAEGAAEGGDDSVEEEEEDQRKKKNPPNASNVKKGKKGAKRRQSSSEDVEEE